MLYLVWYNASFTPEDNFGQSTAKTYKHGSWRSFIKCIILKNWKREIVELYRILLKRLYSLFRRMHLNLHSGLSCFETFLSISKFDKIFNSFFQNLTWRGRSSMIVLRLKTWFRPVWSAFSLLSFFFVTETTQKQVHDGLDCSVLRPLRDNHGGRRTSL